MNLLNLDAGCDLGDRLVGILRGCLRHYSHYSECTARAHHTAAAA
jgi:hypothetical protein